MSTDDKVRCVVCGSDDAFAFFDFSLNGEKRGRCKSCGAGWSAYNESK